MAVRVQVPLRVQETAVNRLIFSRYYFAGYKQGINKRNTLTFRADIRWNSSHCWGFNKLGI